ncbi:hypothetical protein PF010_g24285 [Phytophthora fragariae]|uniref:Uncharacterized protein n=3 Tax=Phytophthora fragariae TaxID=53985 RepID=A0A6G0K3Y4_9STRA|nr:hypothetical protein PF010_g24285 [Phytophthora fragariae]
MLLMGSSQDDTGKETCDASVTIAMLLMSSSQDDTVEETCHASVTGNDSGLSSLEKLGLYRATSSEMNTPSVYSAAFAMQANSAEHENISCASASDVQPYHRFNAGNDTTRPSFDDVGGCDIERMDYEGDGGDDSEDGDDNGHLVEDDDGNDDACADGNEDCGNEYGNDEVVDIRNVACSEFNFTPEDGATLSYEFDFPDYFSDTGSTLSKDDDAQLRVDESLLDLICRHQLASADDTLASRNNDFRNSTDDQ